MKKFEITFGKHKGKTLGEVAKDDVQYVVWFSKNYQQGTYVGYGGKSYPCKPNEQEKGMIIEAKRIAEIAQAKSKAKYVKEAKQLGKHSEFVGVIGTRQEFTMEFLKRKDLYDYSLYTFRDTKGNILTMYSVNFEPKTGEFYKVKGTPKKHKEYNEVQSTHINRVSLISEPIMNKFIAA